MEIHDWERREGFQAKENTLVEWKAKGSLFEIHQEICDVNSTRLEQFFIFKWMSEISLIFQYPNLKNDIVNWSKVWRWSCGVALWVMGSQSYTMLPTGQTLTSEYYINQILEKEMKPLPSRWQVTGGLIERNMFSSKKERWHLLRMEPRLHFKGNSDMVLKGLSWSQSH